MTAVGPLRSAGGCLLPAEPWLNSLMCLACAFLVNGLNHEAMQYLMARRGVDVADQALIKNVWVESGVCSYSAACAVRCCFYVEKYQRPS